MKGYITSSTHPQTFIDPFIDPSSTLHQPKTTPRPPQDHPKTKTRPPIEKVSIFHQHVDLALTLAMGTFTENPWARITIPWNKRRTNVAFASKCWFGLDNGDGHFYSESLCENDNPMKQETHKCNFCIKMLIWRWRWRWALLQRILVREWQFYETRDAQM